MISKKYIIRKSFCVKRAAQITFKSAWFYYKMAAHINILF